MRFLIIAALAVLSSGAMAQANRAWLAPGRLEFIRAVDDSFVIHFRNFGDEPALGFVAQEEIGFGDLKLTDVCARTHAVRGAGIVYPDGDHSYRINHDTTLNLRDGMAYVHGCFAYLAGDVEHKEEYCFRLVLEALGFRSARCALGNDSR